MNTIISPHFFGLLMAGLWLAAAPRLGHAADKIPTEYAAMYQKLEQILDAELAKLPASSNAAGAAQPLVSVDLLAANANRGPELLLPTTLSTVRLSLDRLKVIGIQSVKINLGYPLLRPDFPQAADYLDFYKQVVKEAHARGIKVMPHMSVLFADTPFSPFQGIYQGLDLERFKREYRDMVHLVIRELQPDFLDLLTEPDTHARLTGLAELNRPATIVEVIRSTLKDLDRGKTLIGAGSGSWSSPAFAEAIASQTDVDFIAIHVYPITGSELANVRTMARIARAHHKQAFADEAWLYKVLQPGGNVAATATIFRRDMYSFWQPLDEKFITLMLRLAETEHLGLVSFFWSNELFAYLDYSPELDQMPYRQSNRRFTQTVFGNMTRGKLSAVGEYLQRAIAENPPAAGTGSGR